MNTIKPHCYSIKTLPENARIAILGAGGKGRHVKNKICNFRKDITISAFVDTYVQGTFEGLPVVNIQEIDSLRPTIDLFLIASFWWAAILVTLRSKGVINFGLFEDDAKTKHCMVMDRYRALYIVNNKVAYSSIKTAICDALDIQFRDAYTRKIECPYLDLNDEKYKDYFIFSFVRNPWDRLVSCYEHFFNRDSNHYETINYAKPYAEMLNKDKMTFDDFVHYVANEPDEHRDPHWSSQYSTLSLNEAGHLPDEIGRFESLAEDTVRIFSKAGIPAKIPHLNKSIRSKGHYSKYYRKQTRNMVSQRYQKDIDVFGYAFYIP